MRLRSEEHRALGDTLPPDLKAEAVRLNVAARERGGEPVITKERARELGAKDVRQIVDKAGGDPERAARLVAERTAERAREADGRAR